MQKISQKRKQIRSLISCRKHVSGIDIDKTWGEQIKHRRSQITFSALRRQAPLDAKKGFDPDFVKRKKIKSVLDKTLSGVSLEMEGAATIDIAKPGIDKAYGIYKLHQILDIKIRKTIFIGDALFEGGNDHPAGTTGVICIQVGDPGEAKRVIETVVACLGTNLKSKKV